jgi:geranylgeranylglycerol-phosphate geranylgeranyltransferase
MSQSVIQKEKVRLREQAMGLSIQRKWLPIMQWTETGKELRSGPSSSSSNSSSHFIRDAHGIAEHFESQLVLFNSRKKWGLLFALATISGMFCVPAALGHIQNSLAGAYDAWTLLLINLSLPLSTLLIITGMYVLNDLFDADLDRINGKTNRPIPSGRVSKRQALFFVVLMNILGLSVPVFANNLTGVALASMIALIGIMYSLPKISLKDRFIIKTCAIAIAMACSLLLGASIYLDNYFGNGITNSSGLLVFQTDGQILYPLFASAVLALMVFVTSPLNDLGDIKGDKEAGRKTIPIVLGKRNTVALSMLITILIAASSWIFYAMWTPEIVNDSNHSPSSFALGLPLLVSASSILVVIHLFAVHKRIEDQDYIRRSVGRKSMPLHLLLQISLVVGCFLTLV